MLALLGTFAFGPNMAMGSNRSLKQSPSDVIVVEKLVHGSVQPENGPVQPENGPVLSENGLVQTEDDSAQAENGLGKKHFFGFICGFVLTRS